MECAYCHHRTLFDFFECPRCKKAPGASNPDGSGTPNGGQHYRDTGGQAATAAPVETPEPLHVGRVIYTLLATLLLSGTAVWMLMR